MAIRNTALVLTTIGLIVCAAPAQGADRASEIIASARKAIGDRKIDTMKTLSVDATVQRNMGPMQVNTDTEMLVEWPDKYVRADTMTGPMSGSSTLGFVGDKPLQKSGPAAGGGGLVIRMGPGPGIGGNGPKPTQEEQAEADRALVRMMRQDLSRLMLGWFATTHPSVRADYTYVGEAESPDGKAYVIDVKSNDGFAARLFIDEETRLPLMVTYRAPQPRVVTAGGPRDAAGRGNDGGRGTPRHLTDEERTKMRENAERQMREVESEPPALADYTLFFDEWREVDGIKFPHRIRRAMSGVTSEEWNVGNVKVNPKIDPKKFER